MYLIRGSHGPYFHLHGFRATDALDTKNLKKLKISGTLRYKVSTHMVIVYHSSVKIHNTKYAVHLYQNKELPIIFGHVKKVYLDKSGATKNIWIEASSGMYET